MRTSVLSSIRTLFPVLRAGFLVTLLLPVVTLAAGQQRGTPQRPVFDASVARVRVDVIVTDEDGSFVDDLRADEFVLFEDGVEQRVVAVQRVDLFPERDSAAGPGRRAAERRRAAGAPLPAGDIAPPGQDISELAGVVYVVNGLDVGFRGNSRFARAWGSMLEGLEATDIPHSVYLIDFLGYVHELAYFTQDAAILRSAAEKVRGKSIFGGEVDPIYTSIALGSLFGRSSLVKEEELDPRDTSITRGSPSGDFVGNAGTRSGLPTDGGWSAGRPFEILTALTDVLAQRPGRKALVWVSAGMGFAPPPGWVGSDLDADGDLSLELQRTFERSANSAGVSVYGVDPELVTWHTTMTSAASSEGPADRILENPFALGSFSAGRGVLNEVSEATGGRAFVRWGDIPKVLREVQQETGRFYLLTYALPDPPYDGEYHEIRVEVGRAGVEVRARDGYYDLSDVQRTQQAEAGRRLLAETGPLVETGKR